MIEELPEDITVVAKVVYILFLKKKLKASN